MSKRLIEDRARVTLLTLNRPAVHNNVDHELAMALADAILAFGADGAAKVLLITGAGDRTFCAGNALYMIETGVEIDAHHALRIGLVQEMVPAGTALARALEVAQHIASYPQTGIRADREAALAAIGLSLREGLDLEAELCHPAAVGPEALDGMRRFAEGSRPEPLRPPKTGGH